jgi:PAS domain S-box-containing protein
MRLRLLQIEDYESDAALIVRQLEKAGYVVEARRVDDAASLRDALTNGSWDLIICDYRMPGFEAPAALAMVKESGLDIPFIVISGSIGEELAVSTMRAGAHDYLMKDNLARLAGAVARELREAAVRAERRYATQRLQESEAQLALALDAASMGVFDRDLVTGKGFYNDIARRHVLMEPGKEPTLEYFMSLVHPEDRERVARAVNRAFRLENGGKYAEEYRLRAPNGEERWVSAAGRTFLDPQGKPVRFLGVVRDITDQKRAERELQFQIELIARITEQSRESIMLTDLAGGVRFVNPATVRLFGFTLEEYQASNPHDLIHHHRPDGRPYPASECEASRVLREKGALHEYEDVNFHKDGTPVNIIVSSVALELNGAPIGRVFIYQDITARKKTEQALQRSDERFRKLFEADIIGMMVTGETGIYETNDQFLRMLGYTREEFFAHHRDWRSITPAEDMEASERALRSLLDTGTCAAFEKEYLRKDGTRIPVLFTGVRLNSELEPRFLCFLVDVTERKNLEMQFRQAQKLESVGQLAGGVAHDFNNLLTVIMGYADMLLAQMEPAEPSYAAIEQIFAASLRASGLTRQLLTFSRRNPVIAKTLSLNELLAGVEKMLLRLIGEDIEVVIVPGPDAGWIHADPGLIEQVIFNLAVNARDAMPDGGRLTIGTSGVAVTDEYTALCLSVTPGTYVSLEVTDTGTGMTPEVQARLFEPFFTTKEQGKGTGLGLSTVYGIVKQSGGSIVVQSELGAGSIFRVLFPAVDEAGQRAPAPAAKLPAPGTETILVVEDEPGVRSYVRKILTTNGYGVLDTDRGDAALEIARNHAGAINLLLTDVVLPGMKGTDLIRQFHAVRPGVPVLRMSGYPERAESAREAVCYPYLQKPFKPEALLNRIRKMLDHGGEVHQAEPQAEATHRG